MKVEAFWIKNYRVTVNARQFEVPVDEAPEYSGEDTGMMPTELFLSSLASCFCLALVYAARKNRVEIKDMKVGVIGEKDNKNYLFSKCNVEVKSTLPSSKLKSLVDTAKQYCFVTNTITRSCPIEYSIN